MVYIDCLCSGRIIYLPQGGIAHTFRRYCSSVLLYVLEGIRRITCKQDRSVFVKEVNPEHIIYGSEFDIITQVLMLLYVFLRRITPVAVNGGSSGHIKSIIAYVHVLAGNGNLVWFTQAVEGIITYTPYFIRKYDIAQVLAVIETIAGDPLNMNSR